MSLDLTKVRNIGVAAHIDAGKTTTTERILFYTGSSHRMGEVDEGTTITDFDVQEQKRGITIYSAAVSCVWKGHTINIIDTPGHVDFTAEVERSLRVLDGMVAVFDAKEGVEAQSETVWRQADKYHVPRICFINKMDKAGADFEYSIKSIETRLNGKLVPLQIPMGEELQFEGVIDLLTMKALYFDESSHGSKVSIAEIPEKWLEKAQQWRANAMEKICETDESLIERYLAEEPIPIEDLQTAIRKATIANEMNPVFCGSSLKHMGVQPLLDAVATYLPSPLDMPPVRGESADGKGKEIMVPPDPDAPFAGLLFKIVADKPVDLCFVRIYSGRLKPNSRVLNAALGEKENVTRLLRIYAKRREVIDQAEAGEIVAVIGPKLALTGHTLCAPQHPVLLESIEFPETVISQSIEPSSSRDKDKLEEALKALSRQDPTFRYRLDEETGQTIISGMGELHLEVLVQRMLDDMNVAARVGKPRVSYREAVTVAAVGEGRFSREFAGRQHQAQVSIRIEPDDKIEDDKLRFRNMVSAEKLPVEFMEAVRNGVLSAGSGGPVLGYPMINWRATLVDAVVHPTDSSEIAFEAAARIAVGNAAEAAQPVLMEPIMAVEIRTPDDYFGSINGDLNSRRATITATDVHGPYRIISAEVPLAEMFGYTTHLRSLSQGRATASMEPLRYAAVPANVAAKMTG